MRRLPARLTAFPVLTVAAIALAGCGGSSKPAATSTPATTAPAATTAQAPTTTAASPSASAAASCAQVAGLEGAFAKALTGTAPSDLAARVKLLENFAAKTPASIRPDFAIVVANVSKIVAALKGVSLTSGGSINPAALAKISELGTELKDPRFSNALTAIEAWAAGGCKG